MKIKFQLVKKKMAGGFLKSKKQLLIPPAKSVIAQIITVHAIFMEGLAGSGVMKIAFIKILT